MAIRAASVAAILIGLGLVPVSAASAQDRKPKPGQQGPVKATQPLVPAEWVPDLVITSAKATTVCTAKGTVTATIVATVKNQSPKGTVDVSKVPMQIIVEVAKWSSTGVTSAVLETGPPTIKPQAGGPATLKPGETWTATLDIAGMPKFTKSGNKPGQYGFLVKADPLNAVAESDEKNNDLNVFAFDPCFKS
jgi:CARDB protein